MNNSNPITTNSLSPSKPQLASVINERMQQRQQTLQWISASALDRLQHAWTADRKQ